MELALCHDLGISVVPSSILSARYRPLGTDAADKTEFHSMYPHVPHKPLLTDYGVAMSSSILGSLTCSIC